MEGGMEEGPKETWKKYCWEARHFSCPLPWVYFDNSLGKKTIQKMVAKHPSIHAVTVAGCLWWQQYDSGVYLGE